MFYENLLHVYLHFLIIADISSIISKRKFLLKTFLLKTFLGITAYHKYRIESQLVRLKARVGNIIFGVCDHFLLQNRQLRI